MAPASDEEMRARLRQELARMERVQRRISNRAERSFYTWLASVMRRAAPKFPTDLLEWMFAGLRKGRKVAVKTWDIEGVGPVTIGVRATGRRGWGAVAGGGEE